MATAIEQVLTILLNSKKGDQLPIALQVQDTDLFLIWSEANNRLESVQKSILDEDDLDWVLVTGDRTVGDLEVKIGDYDDSVNGTKLRITQTGSSIGIEGEAISMTAPISTGTINFDAFFGYILPNNLTNAIIDGFGSGKILVSREWVQNLFSTIERGLVAQGNWNADTNTPDITSTTESGYYWIVSVAGNTDLGGITDWEVNDWAIKTDAGWAKIDNSSDTVEWSTFTGTRSGGDLILILGDYDDSGNGTKITIDDDSQEINLNSDVLITGSGGAARDIDSQLFIRNSGISTDNAQVEILAGETGFSNLYFSNTNSFGLGGVVYDHTIDNLILKAKAADVVNVSSAGINVSGGVVGTGITTSYAGTFNSDTNFRNLFLGGSGQSSIKFGSSLYNGGNGAELFQNNAGDFRINLNSTATGLLIKSNLDLETFGNFTIDKNVIVNGVNGVSLKGATNNWINYTNGTSYYIRDDTNSLDLVDLRSDRILFNKDIIFNGANTTIDLSEFNSSTSQIVADSNLRLEAGTSANLLLIVNGSERVRVDLNGNVGVGKVADSGAKLDINGLTQSTQYKLSALNTAPSSATDTGTTGEIRITSGFIYVCIATNTWVRSALATW
jgi:hypothetical protein